MGVSFARGVPLLVFHPRSEEKGQFSSRGTAFGPPHRGPNTGASPRSAAPCDSRQHAEFRVLAGISSWASEQATVARIVATQAGAGLAHNLLREPNTAKTHRRAPPACWWSPDPCPFLPKRRRLGRRAIRLERQGHAHPRRPHARGGARIDARRARWPLARARGRMSLAGKRLLLPARELTAAPEVELQRFVNAGRLAASVACELLSAIGVAQSDVGFVCDQLESGPPIMAAPHVRDAAHDARAAISRAVSRVNSVLSLARSRRGKIAPLDVREVIGAALFELDARLASFAVSTDLSAAPFALAERGALLQTLVSLLLDAAEASPPRGRIWVSLRADAGGVVSDIDDEGAAPISPESLPDRHITPLWLSRNVVRSFGGELTASLGPLGGRRVSVRLRTSRVD